MPHWNEVDSKIFRDLTPQEQPIIYAVGGAPGSGKTTFRKQHLQKDNVFVHDMDEVLIRLPGYQEDLNAQGAMFAFEKWWPTARKLADRMVQSAIASKYSIVYDRTCGAEGSYSDFVRAKERGYRIQITGLYVDKSVAMKRIQRRAAEESRVVSEAVFDEYRARFSALWPLYLSLVDEAVLYDTSDGALQPIFSSQEGVIRRELYWNFLHSSLKTKSLL